MASLKDLVTDNNVNELHNVVENGRQKFLCYTSLSSYWLLAVTDGVDLWKLELDEEELESHRELAEINTNDAFLSKVRYCT